jgi:glycosyltransferase involved in cell wall biosynthesis
MKKLCVIIPSLRFGLRYWQYILEPVARLDIDVEVITALPPSEPGELPLQKIPGRWITIRRKADGLEAGVMYVSPRLISTLVRLRPDVILVTEYTVATAYAIVAGKILGSPVIIMQEHKSAPGLCKRIYRRLLASQVDCIIANTDAAKKEVMTTLGVSESKVRQFPMLVPPDCGDVIKKPVSLPAVYARPLLLFVGQLIARKNVQALLDAMHMLKGWGCSCSLWIVGNGPLRQELESSVHHLQLDDRVVFVGQLPYESTGFAYREADIFVMPTLFDYRSVSVLEAMRFGKPILVSVADGNATDMMRAGENGYVFDPHRAEEIACLTRRFIENPSLIRSMGDSSTQIIASHTPAAAAKQLADAVAFVEEERNQRTGPKPHRRKTSRH